MSAKPTSPGSKRFRYIYVILGLLVLVGGLVFIKFSQISSLIHMGEQMQKAGPPPESVSSAPVELQSWETTVAAVGNIATVKGVALSNDSAGVVSRILFESGALVKQGQVLLELDTSVEASQFASAKARKDLAEITAQRSRALIAANVISQSQVDNDEAQLKTANTELRSILAQKDRKIVKAPFSGRLGIRQVNLGQYLNPGTTLAVLEAVGELFVDFTLPQQRLDTVRVGMPVRIALDASTEAVAEGTITAVEPTVDSATRSLKLRASVADKDDKLRPGMFVNVSVVMPTEGKVIAVPGTAVAYAPFGDSVFVIEDRKADAQGTGKMPDGRPVKVARQQFVKLGQARGDFVSVLDGLKPGQEIVSAGAFKLRNNSPIAVDNRVKATAELDPRPENK